MQLHAPMPVWPILALGLFVTACAPEQPRLQLVRQELPDALLEPCTVAPIPDEAQGDGAFIGWVIDLVAKLDDCNARIGAIRRINNDRSREHQGSEGTGQTRSP